MTTTTTTKPTAPSKLVFGSSEGGEGAKQSLLNDLKHNQKEVPLGFVEDETGTIRLMGKSSSVGNNTTQIGLDSDTHLILEIVNMPGFFESDNPNFVKLKEGTVFPARSILPHYQTQTALLGVTSDTLEINRMIEEIGREQNEAIRLRAEGRVLEDSPTPVSDAAIVMYTGDDKHPWWCTRANMFLAYDLFNDKSVRDLCRIQLLKEAVVAQYPKRCGIFYRGGTYSAFEIFMMAFKRRFYLPSFMSTSTDFSHCLFGKGGSKHNVIFVIDSSEYFESSTDIQDHQTQYDERENLFACYTTFSWEGVHLTNNGVLTVFLKTKIPCENTMTLLKQTVPTFPPGRWLSDRVSQSQQSRDVGIIHLVSGYKSLVASYIRNGGREPSEYPIIPFVSLNESAPKFTFPSGFIGITVMDQKYESDDNYKRFMTLRSTAPFNPTLLTILTSSLDNSSSSTASSHLQSINTVATIKKDVDPSKADVDVDMDDPMASHLHTNTVIEYSFNLLLLLLLLLLLPPLLLLQRVLKPL